MKNLLPPKASHLDDSICTFDPGELSIESLKQKELYMELGGNPMYIPLVDHLHRRIMNDPLLAPKFGSINEIRHKRMTTFLIAHAVSVSDVPYNTNAIRRLHKGLNITDEHFDALKNHLEEALNFFRVEHEDMKMILEATELARDDILGNEEADIEEKDVTVVEIKKPKCVLM